MRYSVTHTGCKMNSTAKKSVFILLLCLLGSGYAQKSGLNFVVIGDWGGQPTAPYTTAAEKEVADQMGKTAADIGSMFTVALGDNFYDTGVTNVDDPRFNSTFESVFTAAALQSKWYVLCGNHDHYGNATAEVAYTKLSKRWYMPDLYYSEVFSIPGTSQSLELVMIDTVVLAGLTHPTLRNTPPPGPASIQLAESQWEWIDKTLSSSTADWIIVAGHYPVWSIAEHGPTLLLVDRLRPLLQKYNVSSYICGHDHNLQHIQETTNPVDYFVAGAGHLTDPSTAHKDDVPTDSLKFHYGVVDFFHNHGGYTTVSVANNTMTTTFYDYKGEQLYTVSRPKTRNN